MLYTLQKPLYPLKPFIPFKNPYSSSRVGVLKGKSKGHRPYRGGLPLMITTSGTDHWNAKSNPGGRCICSVSGE